MRIPIDGQTDLQCVMRALQVELDRAASVNVAGPCIPGQPSLQSGPSS